MQSVPHLAHSHVGRLNVARSLWCLRFDLGSGAEGIFRQLLQLRQQGLQLRAGRFQQLLHILHIGPIDTVRNRISAQAYSSMHSK